MDDCAVVAHKSQELQNILQTSEMVYNKFVVTINEKKTELLVQLSSANKGESELELKINTPSSSS